MAEIIPISKNQPNKLVNVKGASVKSKDSIKALGIQIDKGLTWKCRVRLGGWLG